MEGHLSPENSAFVFCAFAAKELSAPSSPLYIPPEVSGLIIGFLVSVIRQDRAIIIFYSKLLQQTEEYPRMAHVISLLTTGSQLSQLMTPEERNLFSVAWKNTIGPKRAAWRAIHIAVSKQRQKAEETPPGSNPRASLQLQATICYLKRIKKDLVANCNQVLSILDKLIIAHRPQAETVVFFGKMKGDYLRSLGEISNKNRHKYISQSSMEYHTATKLAHNSLPAAHPIRLGLALSLSLFYNQILNDPQKGYVHAKKAFKAADIRGFKDLSIDEQKDATFIMRLLADNLASWAPALKIKLSAPN